jgi:uncharacterized membrane protein YfcA
VTLDTVQFLVAGVAALGAGAVNAVAGGGTLISFPTLVAIGVPALNANVTNTVALCPGYFSGTVAQRADLQPQMVRTKRLAVLGGVIGSVLLEITPAKTFRDAVPWLILMSCVLLLVQDRTRDWIRSRTEANLVATNVSFAGTDDHDVKLDHPSPMLMGTVLLASVYGGYFGAGLGIMLLALLGLFSDDSLVRVNAVKQALSLVINLCAAVVFAITGHVRWELVPIMAFAALIGGHLGGRLSRVVNPTVLRRVVVIFGVAVAVQFWIS